MCLTCAVRMFAVSLGTFVEKWIDFMGKAFSLAFGQTRKSTTNRYGDRSRLQISHRQLSMLCARSKHSYLFVFFFSIGQHPLGSNEFWNLRISLRITSSFLMYSILVQGIALNATAILAYTVRRALCVCTCTLYRLHEQWTLNNANTCQTYINKYQPLCVAASCCCW